MPTSARTSGGRGGLATFGGGAGLPAFRGGAGLPAFGGGRWPPDRLSRAFFAAVARTDGSVQKDFCNIPDSLPVPDKLVR
jgi:hypothetical protein